MAKSSCMRAVRGVCAVAAGLAALAGCERGPEQVRFGDATPERRTAFVGELAQALGRYNGLVGDDKYTNAFIRVRADGSLFVEPAGANMAGGVEHELAVAITDLATRHPGLGFMEEDGGWRVLVPDDVPIAKEAGL